MMRSSVNPSHRSKLADLQKSDDEEQRRDRGDIRKHNHSHSDKDRLRDHKRRHEKDDDYSGKKHKCDERTSRKQLQHAADLHSDSDDCDIKYNKPSSSKQRTDGKEQLKNGLLPSHSDKSCKALVDYGEDSSESVSSNVVTPPKSKKHARRKSMSESSRHKAGLSEIGSDMDLSDILAKSKQSADKSENDTHGKSGKKKKHGKSNNDVFPAEKMHSSVKESGKSRNSSGSSFPEQLSTSLNKILEQEFDARHSSFDQQSQLIHGKTAPKPKRKTNSMSEKQDSHDDYCANLIIDAQFQGNKVDSRHRKSKHKAVDDVLSDGSVAGQHKAEAFDHPGKLSRVRTDSRHHRSKDSDLEEYYSDAENSIYTRPEKASGKLDRKKDSVKSDARSGKKDKKPKTGNHFRAERPVSPVGSSARSSLHMSNSDQFVKMSRNSSKQQEKQNAQFEDDSDMDEKKMSKSRPAEKQKHRDTQSGEKTSKKKRTISEDGEVSSPESSRYDHQSRHIKANTKSGLELHSAHSRKSHICIDRFVGVLLLLITMKLTEMQSYSISGKSAVAGMATTAVCQLAVLTVNDIIG